MTDAEFDAIQWKSGMQVTTLPGGDLRTVVGVNFEYRVLLLADNHNVQNWFFYYQVVV